MTKPRLYLDLDRTLFRTDDFTHQIWQMIETWHPEISGEFELGRCHNFYQHADGMYFYDFAAHVTSLGLLATDIFRRLRKSDLADGRLEYSGVSELINWAKQATRLSVLTYGPDDYQGLKADLCPSLDGVEVITTLKPKHLFFRENRPEGEIWLVDDKPIGDELPPGVRFIQAVGYNDIAAPDECNWLTAASLEFALEQLMQQG